MYGPLIAALCLFISPLLRADTFVIGAQNIQYYPHYDFASDADKGFAWAVLEAFSDATGHEFVYLDMPIRRLQMELLKGNVDFVYPDNPLWYNQIVPAKEKTFSTPLTRALGGTIVKTDNVGKGIEHIRRLAMPLGFTPVNWQQRIDEHKTKITSVTETPSALKLLERDRVDAINLEYHVAKYLASTTPHVATVTLDVDLPYSDIGFRLATIEHPGIIQQLDTFLAQNQALLSRLHVRYGITQPAILIKELSEQQQSNR